MTFGEILPQEICHKHLDSCTHNELKHLLCSVPMTLLCPTQKKKKNFKQLLLKYLMELVGNFCVFRDSVQLTET